MVLPYCYNVVLWNSGSDSDCLERNFKILGKIELGSEKLSGLAVEIYGRIGLLFQSRVIKLSLEISYGIGMSIADICPRPPSLSLQPRSTIIIFCHLTVSSLSHSSVLGFNQLREKCQK